MESLLLVWDQLERVWAGMALGAFHSTSRYVEPLPFGTPEPSSAETPTRV